MRSSGHIANYWRTIVNCLSSNGKSVSDLFLQIMDEEESLGNPLFYLFGIICKVKNRISLDLTIEIKKNINWLKKIMAFCGLGFLIL